MTSDTPALVPELLVRDLDASLAFYLGLCHFQIRYARMEERFAYLTKGGIHLINHTRSRNSETLFRSYGT